MGKKGKSSKKKGGKKAKATQPPASSAPASSTSLLLSVATKLHASGSLEDAAFGYERALAAEPQMFQALINYATCLLELGRPEAALAASDDSMRAAEVEGAGVDGKGRGLALFNRGNILVALGRHKAAALSFHKAFNKNPADADAAFNLGTCAAWRWVARGGDVVM